MPKLNLSPMEQLELSYLNIDLNDLDINITENPLLKYRADDPIRSVLKTIRDPNYLPFTMQHIFNVDILQMQHVLLWNMFHHPTVMLIGSRGCSKTFTLALYVLYRLLINQGIKIVVIGASFRQSKHLYNYCKSIWEKALVLQSMCGSSGTSGCFGGVDRCTVRIGKSECAFLPLADTIRGERAHITITDEFSVVPVEQYETIIKPFSAVSSNPVESVKQYAKLKKMREMGLVPKDYQSDVLSAIKYNQSIIAGTAYYTFNHFYEYFLRYKGIIESRGDPEKLKHLFQGDVPNINWEHYCVMRIPAELVPPGLLNETEIENSKATVAQSVYFNEYAACLLPDTEIITNTGLKKIVDINVGDMVLTHKGRFRPVIETIVRNYSGDIIKYKAHGNNQIIGVTPEHPFYKSDDWLKAEEFEKNDTFDFVHLTNLNNTKEIDITNYTQNYLETIVDNNSYIFPPSSHTNQWVDKHKKNFMCVPRYIQLNYYFGLIVGYYLSAGATGANGKATQFYLDGHQDIKLTYFVDELYDAIFKTFGKTAKRYNRSQENTICVTINSRIIVDLIKNICPGVSHTKFIDPKILYSNAEFLKGFITGYWNGDGCVNKDRIVAACVNKNLLSQVRIALSYFGIKSNLLNNKPPSTTIFRGKEYNTRQRYDLVVSEPDRNKMIELIKNQYYYPILSKENIQQYKIYQKNIEFYNGLVYNLEVEDDHSYSLINATVHNCFADDSNGFFSRKLIETCVIKQPIDLGTTVVQPFSAKIRGSQNCKYAMAVDPASEVDHLALKILECYPDHRRIVYCWVTNKARMAEQVKAKVVRDQDYYGFCARKVRELMRVFNIEIISMDKQGGGVPLMEALADKDKLNPDELPIYPVTEDHPLWDGNKRPTDDLPGLHLIEVVHFARADYVAEANHMLKKDLIDRVLLFPQFDAVSLSRANATKDNEYIYDSLEDCMMEIEETKDELASIQHSHTAGGTTSGREKWDTPETRLSENKKGRARKDRYSALLMANFAARRIQRQIVTSMPYTMGGFSTVIQQRNPTGKLYYGPDWFTSQTQNLPGVSVRRGV